MRGEWMNKKWEILRCPPYTSRSLSLFLFFIQPVNVYLGQNENFFSLLLWGWQQNSRITQTHTRKGERREREMKEKKLGKAEQFWRFYESWQIFASMSLWWMILSLLFTFTMTVCVSSFRQKKYVYIKLKCSRTMKGKIMMNRLVSDTNRFSYFSSYYYYYYRCIVYFFNVMIFFCVTHHNEDHFIVDMKKMMKR